MHMHTIVYVHAGERVVVKDAVQKLTLFRVVTLSSFAYETAWPEVNLTVS